MSSSTYHLDFETYSSADLKKFGAYRYAADPSTEILIMAIAKGDGPVEVWDVGMPDTPCQIPAIQLLREAIETGAAIYAHNAQFESAVCKYLCKATFGIDPPALTQWRCTAAMARRAAIPSSLDAAGAFLGIANEKDKAGAALIRQFSVPRKPTKNDPRKRIMPGDDPEAFARFVQYCRKDVEAEREIHKKLAAFELVGPVLDSFQFDLEMNDRGVPVNVAALRHTDRLVDQYSKAMAAKFHTITGFAPSCTAQALEWFRGHGYPFDNLQAPSVATVLENGPSGWSCRQKVDGATSELPVEMTPEAFEALEIRDRVTFAAVKKVKTMLGAVCPDGMVRGTLLWSGAERTHRWAGRIIQPQNFRRPTLKGKKATRQAYAMLCDGAGIEEIEMMFGPFLEVVASCIRHFIQWPGGQLNQADFSSVEARGAPWLCGGKRKLEMFANGEPIYETMAAKIFGIPVERVIAEYKAGDDSKRFVGKQAELGCTYNMGRPKFRGTCEGFKFTPPAYMVDEFKPRFTRQLASCRSLCAIPQPFTEADLKFSPWEWATLRNIGKGGKFVGRGFTVWAYRKDGTRRKIQDPDNPTPEEWLDLTYDDLADRAVSTWRKDNPEIVAAWRSLDAAAKDAIRNPGKVFKGTEKISFGVTKKPGFRALVMRLPGGHSLIYPKAKLVWKGDPDTAPNWEDNFNTEIQFWGKVPMKSTWGWCKTYGGKFLENATQGICGDFMANGAVVARRHGYLAFMLVHDEFIGPQLPGQSHEELCQHLCTLPDWAAGMPLAADGKTIPFYLK